MAIDKCEPQVIRALEKDRWLIYRKPFTLFAASGRFVLADLALSRMVNGGNLK